MFHKMDINILFNLRNIYSNMERMIQNITFYLMIHLNLTVLILVFWTFISSIISPFLGTYQINELGFSMTLVSILSVFGNVVRLSLTFLFGKLSIGRPLLNFVKIEERVTALAIRSILNGFAAIISTLAASSLFNLINDTFGGEIFGMTVYAQQILALIAVVLGIPYIIYLFSKPVSALKSPSID